MKLVLFGAKGKMGSEIRSYLKERNDLELVAGFDPAAGKDEDFVCVRDPENVPDGFDCILDFSSPGGTASALRFALETKRPIVIGTTGQSESIKADIQKASASIPIFRSVNFSVCYPLLWEFLQKGCALLAPCDVVITERHNRDKLDRPGGTARELAGLYKTYFPSGEAEVHSIRAGKCAGVHEILIANEEENLVIRHEALSRRVFAEGAVKAARFLLTKQNGYFTRIEEE